MGMRAKLLAFLLIAITCGCAGGVVCERAPEGESVDFLDTVTIHVGWGAVYVVYAVAAYSCLGLLVILGARSRRGQDFGGSFAVMLATSYIIMWPLKYTGLSKYIGPSCEGDSLPIVFCKWFFTGVFAVIFPYVLMIIFTIGMGLIISVVFCMVLMLLLILLCRLADEASDNYKEEASDHSGGGGGDKDEGKPPCNAPPCNAGCAFHHVFHWGVHFSFLCFHALMVCIRAFFDLALMISVLTVSFDFGLSFGIDLPMLSLEFLGIPSFSWPCLRMPVVMNKCAATATLNHLLWLSVSTAAITVVISSDVKTMLDDRIARADQVKRDVIRSDKTVDRVALKNKMLQSLVSSLSWLLWKSVEVSIAVGTVSLLQLVRAFAGLEPSLGECELGSWVVSKLLAVYVMVIIVISIVRVLTGVLHSNMIYLYFFPLVESDAKLFHRDQAWRFMSVLGCSFLGMLFPMLPQAEELMQQEGKGNTELQKSLKKAKECVVIQVNKHPGALQPLDIGGAWDSVETFVAGAKKCEEENQKYCLRFLEGPLTLPFGYFSQRMLFSHNVLCRSWIWQAQLESVKRSSASYASAALQLIPVIGVILGKIVQYLNEWPAFVFCSDTDLAARSCRNYASLQAPKEVKPSRELLVLYALSFLKILTLLLALFAFPGQDVTEALLAIFAIAFVEGHISDKMLTDTSIMKREASQRASTSVQRAASQQETPDDTA